MTESPEQFTCIACGGTFAKAWSDEEARAEHDRDYPGADIEDAETVCEDCYQQMFVSPLAAMEDAFGMGGMLRVAFVEVRGADGKVRKIKGIQDD